MWNVYIHIDLLEFEGVGVKGTFLPQLVKDSTENKFFKVLSVKVI